MRIIGGKHRGRVLTEFKGEAIRPTADRVKESVFNILSREIAGARVLDLFCGSGALGLECISRGAKEAVLTYTVLNTVRPDGGAPLTLVRVRLHTGRTHQIRVQFSARRMPLLGDTKYGRADDGAGEAFPGLALWSCRIAFTHPVTGAPIDCACPPPERLPWTLFDRKLMTGTK